MHFVADPDARVGRTANRRKPKSGPVSWPRPSASSVADRRARLKEFMLSEPAQSVREMSSELAGLVDLALEQADEDRPNTERAYAGDQRHYIAATESAKLDFLMPTREFWRSYFTQLASEPQAEGRPCRRHRTVLRHAAGIAALFRQYGLTSPTRTSEHKRLMRKLARFDHRATHKAKPLSRPVITKLLSHETETLRGARDAAIETLGSNRGFRGASITSIRLEHLTFKPKGVLIGWRHQKTDSTYELYWVGVRHQKKHVNCAPCALHHYVQKLNLPRGPAFRKIDRWDHVGERALSPKSVSYLLRHNLRRAGVPHYEHYTSHSYRHWVVKEGIRQGWSDEEIMHTTLHRSRAGLRAYIEQIDPWQRVPSDSLLDKQTAESTDPDRGWRHDA